MMQPLRRVSNPPQRGAALVEFVVISVAVLVPLYLAVQAIAKFGDIRSGANQAARYATWERTVWFEDTSSKFYDENKPNQKSAAAIRSEAMVRVFNDRSGTFKYKDSDKSATTLANGIDPMWQDTAAKPLIDDPAALALTGSYTTPSKDLVGEALALINAVPLPASMTGTFVPPVPSNTLAVVDLKLNKVGEKSAVYQRLWSKQAGLPADWTGIDLVASGGILSNTWGANARTGTRGMVKATLPTAAALGTAVETATKTIMLGWDATQFPRLDLGRVGEDVVPEDRLKK